MKKRIAASLFIPMLALVGCLNKEFPTPVEEHTIDEKFMMQQPFEVPLQKGKVTIVTLNSDTVAMTDIALTIDVPLHITTRAASALQVTYADYAEVPEFTAGSSINIGNHTLWFEDSRQADYDYNDLILQVRHEEVKNESGNIAKMNTFTIKVKGIALGSGKTIGFGFTDVNGKDFDLTDDVRRDYFGGRSGFINTGTDPFVPAIESGDKDDKDMGAFSIRYRGIYDASKMSVAYAEYHPIATSYTKTDNGRVRFKYYIKVDGGQKLYVGEYNQNMEGTLPYGIRMDAPQDFWPLEQVPIGEAFPEFMSWVKTGSPTDWNSTTKADPSKCYQIPQNPITVSRKIWSW